MESQKPSTSKLDLDDLLKALESEEQVDTSTPDNNVVAFLSFYNIEPGEHKVTAEALYKLYKGWTKEPVSRKVFSAAVREFIPRPSKATQYFSINLDPNSLSSHTIKHLDKHTVDRTKSKSWRNHFEAFLNKHEIKSGYYWIEGSLLYHIYDKWLYNNNAKSRLGMYNFMRFCFLYIKETKLTAKGRYFRVDKALLNHVSQETIDNFRGKHDKNKKTKN